MPTTNAAEPQREMLSLVTARVRDAYVRKPFYVDGALDLVSVCRELSAQGLTTALELFRIDVGRYPTPAEGLEVLVKPVGTIPGWNGPYLAKSDLPADPWGRAYVYESGGQGGPAFVIKSYGGDGKEGGTGEDADITN